MYPRHKNDEKLVASMQSIVQWQGIEPQTSMLGGVEKSAWPLLSFQQTDVYAIICFLWKRKEYSCRQETAGLDRGRDKVGWKKNGGKQRYETEMP